MVELLKLIMVQNGGNGGNNHDLLWMGSLPVKRYLYAKLVG
jgi:hypothetical protein